LKGIILHGGHGTRLQPLTYTRPKQLLTIANKPMSRYAVEEFVEAGITDIAMVIGDIFPEKVEDYYGDGSKFGAKITYIRQQKPEGIAQAIGLCKDFICTDKFIVYLGDNILKDDLQKFSLRFSTSDADALILLCEVKDPSRFGIAAIEGDKIRKITEKPKQSESKMAVIGIYFLTPRIFEVIDNLKPSWRGELEITEALQMLILSGSKVDFDYVTGWWKDLGTPEDILNANCFILDGIRHDIKGLVESENSLQGRIIIGNNTRVEKEALIRGPVIIGENCLIEAGVYVGPFTSIGNNVQLRNGEFENSIIMDHCEIDTKSRIMDSIIAHHSKIIDVIHPSPRGHRFLLGERSEIML
jgi:glucose-1-phosphate thymidylyltransferase